MSCSAEAHGHFLYNNGHDKRKDNERKEESDAELRAGCGIGEHAGSVILTQHDQDARANEQPQQPRSVKEAAVGARFRHSDTVMSAIHVFVGNDDDFVAGNAIRLWRLETYAHGRVS
jgi:hypothetical protein